MKFSIFNSQFSINENKSKKEDKETNTQWKHNIKN